jgi:hypothetical protein
MNNEQKAAAYGQLLNEHTRIGNQIAEIKGQNLELNQQQLQKVKQLESLQVKIMRDINRLFTS